MFRLFFRFVGYALLVVAFIALVLDGVGILATGDVKFAVAGQSWTELAPASLNQVQYAIQEHLGLVSLWDRLVQPLLLLPTALLIAIFGLIFCLLGRQPRKRDRLLP